MVTSATLVENLIRTGLGSLPDANIVQEARNANMKLSVPANRLIVFVKEAGFCDFEGIL